MLLIQRMKRSGPSTDPWGTPLVPVRDLDVKHCVLSKRLLLHQPTVCSDSPLAMSLGSKIAFDRSLRRGAQCCLLFNVVMKSSITLKGCCSCAVSPMLARCRFLFVTPLSALFPFTPIPPILHQFTKSCLLCFFTLCTTVSRCPFNTNKYSNIVRLPCCWFHLFVVIQGLSWDQIKFLKPPNSGRRVLSENLQRWLTHPKVHRFSVRTDFQHPHVTRPIADIVSSFVKSVFVYICFSVPLLRTCTCLILNLLY